MKTLTAQQLALYLGCEIEISNPEGSPIREILSCVEPKMKKAWGESGISWNTDDIKPILRPLSDIQKEEVADLMGVEGFIERGNYLAPFFQIDYRDLQEEPHFQHQYVSQLSPVQVVFLLSKHFDLFGFIDSGLAIDHSTLTSK